MGFKATTSRSQHQYRPRDPSHKDKDSRLPVSDSGNPGKRRAGLAQCRRHQSGGGVRQEIIGEKNERLFASEAFKVESKCSRICILMDADETGGVG